MQRYWLPLAIHFILNRYLTNSELGASVVFLGSAQPIAKEHKKQDGKYRLNVLVKLAFLTETSVAATQNKAQIRLACKRLQWLDFLQFSLVC